MEPSAPKELKEMHKLVCSFMILPECRVFREPVDWKGLELKDYLTIVKNPMDLGTVKTNLETGVYQSKEEAARDVRLVWTNCMLYNGDGSEFYHLADKFSRAFEESYRRVFVDSVVDSENYRVPTIEEKVQLSHDVFKISSAELARVLTMIEEDCPLALSKKVAADEVLVNFDAISPKAFHEVSAFVTTCMVNAITKKSKKRKEI